MWQGDPQRELQIGAIDAGPWLVSVNPPMDLALAFQTAAEVQLATNAVTFL